MFSVAAYAILNLVLPAFRSPFIQNIFTFSPTEISVHRWLGRLYVLAVMVGGVAGFFLALNSFGGLVTHFGFGLMAICWVGTTLVACWQIRNGNVLAHRDWMLRSYALTLAGVTLRVYLGISTLVGIDFADFYPVLSWICWVPNLLIVEWLVLTRLYKTSKV